SGPATLPNNISASTQITALKRLRMTGTLPRLLIATAALMDDRGRILLARRLENADQGGMWEFPGGKVEIGEMPEEALIREVKEELGVTVRREDIAPLTFTSYRYPKRDIV